ncbi:MAG: YnbE family lipoprotein [Pseudomonadota bacterium]
MNRFSMALLALLAAAAAGCTHKVKVEAPDKPIEINLNVDLRVRLEREVEDLIANNPDLF